MQVPDSDFDTDTGSATVDYSPAFGEALGGFVHFIPSRRLVSFPDLMRRSGNETTPRSDTSITSGFSCTLAEVLGDLSRFPTSPLLDTSTNSGLSCTFGEISGGCQCMEGSVALED